MPQLIEVSVERAPSHSPVRDAVAGIEAENTTGG
jgi:hypothetical protein